MYHTLPDANRIHSCFTVQWSIVIMYLLGKRRRSVADVEEKNMSGFYEIYIKLKLLVRYSQHDKSSLAVGIAKEE